MFSRRAHQALRRATLAWVALAFAGQVGAATITGTVFEDRNYGGGAGRSLLSSGGQPLANVRVELYRQSTGAFVDSDTTNGIRPVQPGQRQHAERGDGAHRARRQRHGALRTHGGRLHDVRCRADLSHRRVDGGLAAAAVTNRVGGETPRLSRRGIQYQQRQLQHAQPRHRRRRSRSSAGRSGQRAARRSTASTSASTSTRSSTRAMRRAARRPARTARSIRARAACGSSSSTPTRSAAKARSRRRAAASSTARPRRCRRASSPASS